VHNHFPNWRGYQECGGGGLADMGAHHFDIAQWALGTDDTGPVEVIPPSGDAPYGLKFVYANGIEMFHGGPSGATFEGTDGRLYVDRGELTAEPATILEEPLGAGDVHLEDPEGDHAQNWIDCIRSRNRPITDVAIGHRSATICHLANIGYRYRRPLRWDPENERFIGDTWANDDLSRPQREPWTLGG
jgi:predicted dehydrogenase